MTLRLALAFVCAGASCLAQTPNRLLDTNTNSWWIYNGENALKNSRWSVLNEIQFRRTNFAAAPQQLLIRDALLYELTPNVHIGIGHAFVRTSRYGDYPIARAFQENRIFGQLALKHSAGKVGFEHRYRLEQRWLQAFTATGSFLRPQQRFRYQAKMNVPIKGALYFVAADEVFIGFGQNYGASHLDQNRIYAGFGYKPTKNTRIELHFMNQFIVQRNGLVEEDNHTLRIQFSNFAPFGKRK